ncbi:MAG TPA: hypothetical protein PLL69_12840 [Gemmatimonadales bacterium]|nr:hypothetical protein [Gemmatimonadales bacterium]
MRLLRFCPVLALFALAACGDELPVAVFQNSLESHVLGDLNTTPLQVPSAFSIPAVGAIRTDQSAVFDFAYVREGDRHYLVPLEGLGIVWRNPDPGLQKSGLTFEALIDPPSNGYITDDSLEVQVGDVVIARSRIVCGIGVANYAKLLITAIDDEAGTLSFDSVVNLNCGYRSLALGLPKS